MSDNSEFQVPAQAAVPNPALRTLDRLVGEWRVQGDSMSGQIRFEWMEAGYFLVQHIDLLHDGREIKGMEIIGWDEARQVIASQYFNNSAEILPYVWQVDDTSLTIWGGEVGSAARYDGKFSEDGDTNSGAWQWPGGGYNSSMTRVG